MKKFLNKMAVAARLAGKEVQCLRLTNFDLARADARLGEKAYSIGSADGQAELVSKLDVVTQRLRQLRQEKVEATSTFADKAKAFAGKIARAVELQRKRRRICKQLGRSFGKMVQTAR